MMHPRTRSVPQRSSGTPVTRPSGGRIMMPPGATPMPACPVWMSMMGIRSQVVRTGSTQRSAGKAMESPWMGRGRVAIVGQLG